MDKNAKQNMLVWGAVGAVIFMACYYIAYHHFPKRLMPDADSGADGGGNSEPPPPPMPKITVQQ